MAGPFPGGGSVALCLHKLTQEPAKAHCNRFYSLIPYPHRVGKKKRKENVTHDPRTNRIGQPHEESNRTAGVGLRALEEDAHCADVLQRLAAARGAINSLMGELLEDHILNHMPRKTKASAEAAQDIIEIVRTYLK